MLLLLAGAHIDGPRWHPHMALEGPYAIFGSDCGTKLLMEQWHPAAASRMTRAFLQLAHTASCDMHSSS